jgi:hypothetical protein
MAGETGAQASCVCKNAGCLFAQGKAKVLQNLA